MAAFQRALARPKLALVLAVSFLVMTAFASFESIFAWVGVVLALVQGVLVGRVVPLVGEHRLVPSAILVMVVALAAIASAPSVGLLMAGMGLLAMGMGFNSPSMLSVVSRLADPTDQGSTLGVSQSLASLARIVGPMWGGFVYDRFGHTVPFYTASALMLIACGLSVLVFRGFELRPAPVVNSSL